MELQLLKDFDSTINPTQSPDDIFVDIDLSFSKNKFSNDLNIKKGTRSISQSLHTILKTNPNDLDFDEDFGVGIDQILGENNDPISLLALKERISDQISRYEPRIELIEIDTRVSNNQNLHSLAITLYYIIKNTSVEEQITIEIKRVL